MSKKIEAHPLILASGSPRRRELLASLGVEFQVIKPNVDEEAFDLSHLSPEEVVKFLSRTKAQAVYKEHTDAVVIGSDTIVVLDGEIFGKPKDEQHAFEMLKVLQGRTHAVYSGITVFSPLYSGECPGMVSDYLKTDVTMRPMTEAEIWDYIKTGEPMDKAGAYAIQGLGSTIIEKVNGCYFNVVGMSLFLLARQFEQLGLSLTEPAGERSPA